LIVSLAASSAFSFPIMLQWPGVHINLMSLFDLYRRLLINKASGSVNVVDCRLVEALSESEHLSIFVLLISWALIGLFEIELGIRLYKYRLNY